MLSRLPYRVQIPLGLSLAVVLAALLVTAVAAQIFARTARADTLTTVKPSFVAASNNKSSLPTKVFPRGCWLHQSKAAANCNASAARKR